MEIQTEIIHLNHINNGYNDINNLSNVLERIKSEEEIINLIHGLDLSNNIE